MQAMNHNDRLIAEQEHSFVFLSALLGRPVHDANGLLVGQLSDLRVSVASLFPPVVGFVVQRGRWEPFAMTGRWSDVADITPESIRLGVGIQALTPAKTDTPGEVPVRESLLEIGRAHV